MRFQNEKNKKQLAIVSRIIPPSNSNCTGAIRPSSMSTPTAISANAARLLRRDTGAALAGTFESCCVGSPAEDCSACRARAVSCSV
jgi:hypothetical protein